MSPEGRIETAFAMGYTGPVNVLVSGEITTQKTYSAFLAGMRRLKLDQKGLEIKVELTAKEIADLAELAGFTINIKDIQEEDLETTYTVADCPIYGVKDDYNGNYRHYTHIAYSTEYPDKGVAPLGDELNSAGKMKSLLIVTTTEYYQQFLSGEKPGMEELRPYGARWNENTCVIGRSVILSAGYGKKHRAAGRIIGFRTSQTETKRPEYKAIYGDKHTGKLAACIKIELEQGDSSV